MQLKCIAIDDEPPALALVRDYIARCPSLQLLHTFDDAITGGEYLRQHSVDLLFVDINMPDITGLDLVRSLEIRPMIIFTTAHKKFAFEGFELDAVDYLLKPVSFERFSKAVQKAVEYAAYRKKTQDPEAGHLFVYAEYRLLKIDFGDIGYIESLEDYIRIHLLHGKPVMTLMTLKGVLEKLPPGKFQRVHRSYIVATGHIRSVLNRRITLISGVEIPVSDSYAGFLKEWKSR
ncbi:MAG: LytTR family DNA-binding domain-containing protein [Chitinophagaceae bacterium]